MRNRYPRTLGYNLFNEATVFFFKHNLLTVPKNDETIENENFIHVVLF